MKIVLFLLSFIILNLSQAFASYKNHHFVLVTGINGESLNSYFSSFKALLHSEGAVHVSIVKPSSMHTVSENIPMLKRRLLKLHEESQLPLVIFAHSKGGLEVANMLSRNIKDFPIEVLSAAVFVNTPFQGSPYMAKAIKEYIERWGWGGNQYNPVYISGLKVLNSLSTEVITEDLAISFSNLSNDDRNSLHHRFFYIRTYQDASKVASGFKQSAQFLKPYGLNDGMIPLENQKLSFLGSDLDIFNGIDHGDLFVQKWTLNSEQSVKLIKTLRFTKIQ